VIQKELKRFSADAWKESDGTKRIGKQLLQKSFRFVQDYAAFFDESSAISNDSFCFSDLGFKFLHELPRLNKRLRRF
jgi:hypothetical protein